MRWGRTDAIGRVGGSAGLWGLWRQYASTGSWAVTWPTLNPRSLIHAVRTLDSQVPSNSMTQTLTGLARGEGLTTQQDRLLEWGPPGLPQVCQTDARMGEFLLSGLLCPAPPKGPERARFRVK